MATPALRRSFFAFHVTLGLVLLVFSVKTALDALSPAAGHLPHVAALIGTIEAVGAVLFLFPRTLRTGGALLLLSIGVALLLHGLGGQFRGDLLIYAAGTWFVMVHGPAWPTRGITPGTGMRAAALAALALFGVSAAACRPATDVAAAEQQLLARDRHWAAAAAGGNADSIVSYWDDSARILMAGAPTVIGRSAARQMVAGLLATPGFKIGWTPAGARVAASGDLGYTWGTNSVTLPDPAGHPVTTVARYITVWRKSADGQWRCLEDMSTPGPEAPAGASH